jgi:hypothetical protein
MVDKQFSCPVCKVPIPAGSTHCPDCGEDLSDLIFYEYEADIKYNQALDSLNNDNLDRAIFLLLTVIELDPAHVEAINTLGKLYVNRGQLDPARKVWEKGSSTLPEEESFKEFLQQLSEREKLVQEEKAKKPEEKKSFTWLWVVGGLFIGALLFFITQIIFNYSNTPKIEAFATETQNAFMIIFQEKLLSDIRPVIVERIITATPAPQTPIPTITPFPPTNTLIPTNEPTQTPLPTIDLLTIVKASIEADERLSRFPLLFTQQGTTILVIGEVPDLLSRYLVESTIRGIPGVDFVDLKDLTLGSTYIVKRGDTPSHVASILFGDWTMWKKIMEYNKIPPPYYLHVGQELLIPPP